MQDREDSSRDGQAVLDEFGIYEVHAQETSKADGQVGAADGRRHRIFESALSRHPRTSAQLQELMHGSIARRREPVLALTSHDAVKRPNSGVR
jgi:hypothetical protein